MVLTPLDIEHARFKNSFRGYQRDEVERFRSDVMHSIEDYIDQIGQLRARIGELEVELHKYRESEELLKSSVVLAQRTCDELIASAHKQADAIMREAEGEGEGIRRQFANLRSQREQFEYAFHGLLTGFMHRLEQGNPQLAAHGDPAPELPSASGASREPIADSPEEPAHPDEAPHTPLHATPPPVSHVGDLIVPTPPDIAAPPVVPPVSVIPSAAIPAGELDRDADIQDFTAALESAETQPVPSWPPADSDPVESSPAPEEEAAFDEDSLFVDKSSPAGQAENPSVEI